MARKNVATPEGVIRYFLTATNANEIETTFKTVRTILDSRGMLTKRKTPKAKEAGFAASS